MPDPVQADAQEAKLQLFLSYAEEDQEAAAAVATWLEEHGFEVFYWQDPRQRGRQFIQRFEELISEADAFLALLSPSFSTSPWCRLERNFAKHRELDLQASDPDRVFIHVLRIAATSYVGAGFLSDYDWFDLTGDREQELSVLTDRLRAIEPAAAAPPGTTSPSQRSPLFRNRRDELDKLVRGVTNAGGPHFWLVIAPPELGKSWFLDRLNAEVAQDRSSSAAELQSWTIRLIDVGELSVDERRDALVVLARLFGLDAPLQTEHETLVEIARRIVRGGRPYLCLLDSADLLRRAIGGQLRSCLSKIYHLVQEAAGDVDVRLAFVVASRREDEWRGVSPDPRLSAMPLTEFKVDVVRNALRDLAQQRNFSAAQLQQHAARVHKLSEGLPALLVRCLQWIQAEEWVGLDRLEHQALFEQLARPYVQEGLLSATSLVPWGGRQRDEERAALEEAFRVLAPYRLFTQSHLRHHVESDGEFAHALARLGWPIEDLWGAINGTALLLRPLNEPWQEIYAPIRRLLFHYYHRTDEERAQAHQSARKFVEVWVAKQAGKEQIVGVVECLWHEAVELRHMRPTAMAKELSKSAKDLSRTLGASSAYTAAELRAYATERMRNDEELQEAVGDVPGLFDQLVKIVAAVPRGSRHRGGSPEVIA